MNGNMKSFKEYIKDSNFSKNPPLPNEVNNTL